MSVMSAGCGCVRNGGPAGETRRLELPRFRWSWWCATKKRCWSGSCAIYWNWIIPEKKCQIVVVSDGSTDGTEAILREHARNPQVHVLLNQLTGGKAMGLNAAMSVAQGDIVVFTDARQKIDPGAIRLLMKNFADPEVGAASGELMLGDPAKRRNRTGNGIVLADRKDECVNWRPLPDRWSARLARSMRSDGSWWPRFRQRRFWTMYSSR